MIKLFDKLFFRSQEESSKNYIFQNQKGEYLSEFSQLNSVKSSKYTPHDSTRYINVFLGDNNLAMRVTNDGSRTETERTLPELYQHRQNCCGCTACYSICPMSGDDRPDLAKRLQNNQLKIVCSSENSTEPLKTYHIKSVCSDLVEEITHTGAITMMPDEEGFLYPVVDAEICIRCYKCIAVCSFKEHQKIKGLYYSEHS